MEIVNAQIAHLPDCLEAVLNSKLGQVYYADVEKTTDKFKTAIREKQLFVAINDQKEVLGYCWIVPKGMFGIFPYLRSIATKKDQRGKGVGKALLHFFEKRSFEEFDHIYLLVSSFNPNAKRLYESVGYREIGVMDNWIVDNVDEYIMHKRRPRS